MSDKALKLLEELLFADEAGRITAIDAIADEVATDRTEKVTVRLQPAEKNTLLLNARNVPLSKYIRSCLFGYDKPPQLIIAPEINRDFYVELLKIQKLIEQQLRKAKALENRGLVSDWSERALLISELRDLIVELRKEVVALSVGTSETESN